MDWEKLATPTLAPTEIPPPPRLELGPVPGIKLEHAGRLVLVVLFEDSTNTGAIWNCRQRRWMVTAPISRGTFETTIAHLFAIEQTIIDGAIAAETGSAH